MYLSFDEIFYDRWDALMFARKQLGKYGDMVSVTFSNVPDCKCKRCGGLLFDFQKEDALQTGMAGDMIDCFWSESYGVICDDCSLEIASQHIESVNE